MPDPKWYERPAADPIDGLRITSALEESARVVFAALSKLGGALSMADHIGFSAWMGPELGKDRTTLFIYDTRDNVKRLIETGTHSKILLAIELTSSGRLRLLQHRTLDLTSQTAGRIVSPSWLLQFLMENQDLASKFTPEKGIRHEERSLCQDPVFYVYVHKFSNGDLYIGKGSTNRAYSFSGRNQAYELALYNCGKPEVLVTKSELDEASAYLQEASLIRMHINKGSHLLNVTAGGESLPLIDMPGETIERVRPFARDPAAFRTVSLMSRSPATSDIIIIGQLAIDVAITTKLTIREVLQLHENPELSIGTWQALDQNTAFSLQPDTMPPFAQDVPLCSADRIQHLCSNWGMDS